MAMALERVESHFVDLDEPELYPAWRLCNYWASSRCDGARDSMNIPRLPCGRAPLGKEWELPEPLAGKWKPYRQLFATEKLVRPSVTVDAQMRVDRALCRLYPRTHVGVADFLFARHWDELEPQNLIGLKWDQYRAKMVPLTPDEALEWLYRYLS